MLADDQPTRVTAPLEAVHPPRPTTPVIAPSDLPCITGKGSRDYSCPGCRRLLLAGVAFNQIQPHTIFRCPNCGTYSRLPLGR